ncbi:MAG: 2-dehydropantoate 2-reductase [Dehalococcoidia bacterium]
MRIAVMGSGGVGGYYGALLARAGNQVTFIARGAHLEAIRRNGIHIKSREGEFTVQAPATDDPGQVEPVELVLFTVKTYHNAQAIPLLKPLVSGETAVLTLQNGVESYLELQQGLGPQCVLPGLTYVAAEVEAPGVIRQQGRMVAVIFGELSGEASPRTTRVLETFQQAGIDITLTSEVLKELWTKFIFIATLAGVTTACRTRLEVLLEHPETQRMLLDCAEEIAAVGRAKQVALDEDVVAKTVQRCESAARHLKASMHTDLEQGRPLELEALNGAVARMGSELGIPTPVNRLIYAMLTPYVQGAP